MSSAFARASASVLWHNPKCSKSRAALALLQGRGVPFSVREYLEEPPTLAELETLHKALGRPPLEWVRTGEPEWKGVGGAPSESDVLKAIVSHPSLLERPIFVSGERAVVGRPPETVLTLLGGS